MRHTFFFPKTIMCKPLQFKGEAHRDEEVSQISVVKLMRRLPFLTRQIAFNSVKNIQVLFSLMFPLMRTPFKKRPTRYEPLGEGAPHFATGGARRGYRGNGCDSRGAGEEQAGRA